MQTSFKDSARSELLGVLPQKRNEIIAFLSALAKTCGSIEIAKKRYNLCFWLADYDEGLKVVELLKTLYPADFELSLDKTKTGAEACSVQVPSGFSKQALEDFGLMQINVDEYLSFVEGIPQDVVATLGCKVAYFKGLFLGCGSVYVPSTSEQSEKRDGYHFELQLDDDLFADDVMELLSDLRINTRMSERGEHKLVYVKDKDEIVKVLAVLELSDCVLKLQSIIDERETANSLNRVIICETANLDKTFTAASKHLLAIGELKNKDIFDTLPVQLKETANARAEHPEASLNELAEILGVSKSCLNHRLRKIVELAQLNCSNGIAVKAIPPECHSEE